MSETPPAPLPEYAGRGRALIEPTRKRSYDVRLPPRAVLCFFGEVLRRWARRPEVTRIHALRTEMGRFPVYALGRGRNRVALLHPGIGAPLAAGCLENVIGLGVRAAVACGGAGVLHAHLEPGTVILPTSALRDEGTSHHYLPRGRRCTRPAAAAVRAIRAACIHHEVPVVAGRTWTTDAFFRETPRKIGARREEGCIAVEMEAAALFAVARFRGVPCGQLLYAGDDVSGAEWNARRWNRRPTARERLLLLAIEAVRRIPVAGKLREAGQPSRSASTSA